MGGKHFNPDTDIPDLSGKVIFVTGGNDGLGKAAVQALAKHHPQHIYLSGRNSNKGAAVVREIKAAVPNVPITFIECDLASLASVEKAANKFTSETQRLDVLMCNAGIMAQPPGLTEDGYELHFGTNHLGHALLIKLLLPTMLRTAEEPNSDVRIVILTSAGFRATPMANGIVFKDLRTTQDMGAAGGWMRYGQSKLANLLYATELARRYPSITTVSIHPGVVGTGLVANLSILNKALVYVTNLGKVKTPTEGVWNQLFAATGKREELVSGQYYEPVGVLGQHNKYSNNKELAERLWEWTQEELKGYQA